MGFDSGFPTRDQRTDAELIAAVRAGGRAAYAELWIRHEAAARRFARRITDPNNTEDLVSESFLRVLTALNKGGGPRTGFRSYLFTTLRRVSINAERDHYRHVILTDEEAALAGEPSESAAAVLVRDADGRAAWQAWSSLPERPRTLIWYLLIEERTAAQIAPLLGTTRNGVSLRALRAKERLRQAFLRQQLQGGYAVECQQARDGLGSYVRGALSVRDRAAVGSHLDACGRCEAAMRELAELNANWTPVNDYVAREGKGA